MHVSLFPHVNLVYQMGLNLPFPVLRGVLKNAAAAFPPLGRAHILLRTLRPSKQLRPSLRHDSGQDWTSLFEHSLIFSRVGFGTQMLMERQNI